MEIELVGDACAAAKQTTGTRYLCDRAPLLPLKECDRRDRCACRYVRYSDRRDSPRRKSEGALPSQLQQVGPAERRHDQGRRTEERNATGQRKAWVKDTWE